MCGEGGYVEVLSHDRFNWGRSVQLETFIFFTECQDETAAVCACAIPILSGNEVWCQMLDICYERNKSYEGRILVKALKKSWCQAALGPIG